MSFELERLFRVKNRSKRFLRKCTSRQCVSKLTIGEDIADLGGTILAYMAWKSEIGAAPLPDIDGLSPDKRFFIGFAQWACGSHRPEAARVTALTSQHSPSKYRVNGVVVNMPEFQKAFGCKAKQPMVKDTICKIW
ncbi:MAG: hypothetical protein EOP07_22200 [Proteobacteria bacterium]|nr:MAG: hypothetical protein EOP07_22200 [Pseudomonadota bacterium]